MKVSLKLGTLGNALMRRFDVAVVGGGIAGTTAAVEAEEDSLPALAAVELPAASLLGAPIEADVFLLSLL